MNLEPVVDKRMPFRILTRKGTSFQITRMETGKKKILSTTKIDFTTFSLRQEKGKLNSYFALLTAKAFVVLLT